MLRQRAAGRREGEPGRLLLAAAAGYLIGTFPTADIVSSLVGRARKTARPDLRVLGSGNPGGLNAWTSLGRRWGLLVIAGDIGKGVVAAVTGRRLGGDDGAYAAGAAAVAGHCYPVWNGFRGGKGVATSFGTELVCMPAYAPLDVGVATASFMVANSFSRNENIDEGAPANVGTYAASAAFNLAALVTWLMRLRPLWSPRPSALLPLYALTSSATIALRFFTAPKPRSGR